MNLLTQSDNFLCLHTLKKGAPNAYKDVMEALARAYQHMSEFMLGFGFGAKMVKKKAHTSDCFAMSGDIFNPAFEGEELYEMYSRAIKAGELSFPCHYKKVIQ